MDVETWIAVNLLLGHKKNLVRLLLLGLTMKTKIKKILIACSVLIVTSGCQKNQTEFTPINNPNLAGNIDETQVVTNGKCIQVYYDKTTDPNYNTGRSYGLMLLNLLGHFPEYQQVTGPIELYKKGDLDRCHASFYIGSSYNNAIPAAFIGDYLTTTKRVIWLGYSVWQLGLEFENTFGYSSTVSFTTLDTTNKTADGKPSFFRDIIYKGETFAKYGKYADATNTTFAAAPELVKFQSKLSDKATVMATAKHSFTNEVIPWALKAGNKYYVTEVPFSYVHEGDRYLVFADLLFDFLDEQPKSAKKYAMVRLEDVNPMSDQGLIDKAVGIMKKYAVTPHIAITPIYESSTQTVRMENSPLFLNLMQRYQLEGTIFMWHGNKYPYITATSNASVSDLLGKLEDGFGSLKVAGIAPQFWITPNYTASTVDNIIFGKSFSWNIGRGTYTDYKMKSLPAPTSLLTFDLNDPARARNREIYFADITVSEVPNPASFGQFFPYEIYGNQYGQKVIPENLGNVTPTVRKVADILADAKRNLVLRDVWASVFYHPYLLSGTLNPDNIDPVAPTDLEKMVTGLQTMGYQFVNLNEYSAANTTAVVKARVELEATRQ